MPQISQTEWPLPWSVSYPNSLRTWTWSFLVQSYTIQPTSFDWPLTPAVKRGVVLGTFTYAPNPNLFGKDALPFRQQDWPLTPPVKRGVALGTFEYAPNPNLAGQDALPFRQRDWPLSKAPLRGVAAGEGTDGTRLALVNVTAPFAQTDWPLPRVRLFDNNLRTWTQSFVLQNYTIQPSAFDWPLTDQYTRSYPRDLRSFTASYNLNLIGKDNLPLRQADWPLPAAKAFDNGLRSFVDGGRLTLSGAAVLPFRQQDWPLQRVAPREAYSWVNFVIPDPIDLPRVPMRAPMWVPRGAPRWDPPNILLTTLSAPVAPPPIGQFDWPLPRAPYYSNSLRSWTWGTAHQFYTIQPGTYAWEAPPRPPFQPAPLQTNLVALTTAPVKPLNQTDWPLTPPVKRGVELSTFTYGPNPNLAGQDALPFRQRDWPLPVGPNRSIDLRAWAITFQPPASTTPPVVPIDWPLPQPPRREPTLTTIARPAQVHLIGQDALPFRQQDWPNPRTAQYPTSARTWLDQTRLALAAVAPLQPIAWPLPPGPRRDVTLATWTNSVRLQLLGQDALPFRQCDWPLPRNPFPALAAMRSHVSFPQPDLISLPVYTALVHVSAYGGSVSIGAYTGAVTVHEV